MKFINDNVGIPMLILMLVVLALLHSISIFRLTLDVRQIQKSQDIIVKTDAIKPTR